MPEDTLGRAMQTLVKRDNVTVMPLPLGVYAPVFSDNYVSYKGSLTTPPCSESVVWIINIKSQNISTSLVRHLKSEHFRLYVAELNFLELELKFDFLVNQINYPMWL